MKVWLIAAETNSVLLTYVRRRAEHHEFLNLIGRNNVVFMQINLDALRYYGYVIVYGNNTTLQTFYIEHRRHRTLDSNRQEL